MTARLTLEMLRLIADDIEKRFPEHADYLRAVNVGQSGKRTASGHTSNNLRFALLWCQIRDRIGPNGSKTKVAEVLAAVSEEQQIDEDSLDNLWMRAGRPRVTRILKENNFNTEQIELLVRLAES